MSVSVSVHLIGRRRRMLARGYEQLLADARRPPGALTARIPVRRDQVLAAAPDIERLVRLLRDPERAIDPRALDAARELISSAGGPVYVETALGTLSRRVRVVCEAME